MEFGPDGILDIQSILILDEMQRDANRAEVADLHNMSIDQIVKIGHGLAKHCLRAVAENRQLLLNEGALNSELRNYLLTEGIEYRTGGTSEEDFINKEEVIGEVILEQTERVREGEGVNSDLLVDKDNKRVELKTAAIASPKPIPASFFEKDLNHLQSKYLDDLSLSSYDGARRDNRSAELAMLVCDKHLAISSSALYNLLGDLSSADTIVSRSSSGITYRIETGRYSKRYILRTDDKDVPIDEFVVILATPSIRE